jgi:ComF family protein
VCAQCWPQIRFFEPPWCEVLGTPFAYDLGDGIVSAEALANPPPFRRLRSVAVYDGITGALVRQLKYGDGTHFAPWLAAWMIRTGRPLVEAAEVVVPIPLHRTRLLMRRYNQSAELARAIAATCGKPYRPEALVRRKRTAKQTGLSATARADNVRGAFIVPEGEHIHVAGRNVLLVDDVYTTGATVSASAKALLKAGASAVDVLTFARAMHEDFQALGA